MEKKPYELDDREHATVLGALRFWQASRAEWVDTEFDTIASVHGEPLTNKDIDALCERLNCGQGPQFMAQWENAAHADFCGLTEIVSANSEVDAELCEWAKNAKVGESFRLGGGAAPLVTTWRIS